MDVPRLNRSGLEDIGWRRLRTTGVPWRGHLQGAAHIAVWPRQEAVWPKTLAATKLAAEAGLCWPLQEAENQEHTLEKAAKLLLWMPVELLSFLQPFPAEIRQYWFPQQELAEEKEAGPPHFYQMNPETPK